MTLRELAREGETILQNAGVPDAGHDARTLLLDTFHINTSEYILLAETELSNAFRSLSEGIAMPLGFYRDRIKMRAARIPLQQILGEAAFMGSDFKVNEFTLCPRPDTETLVETVIGEVGNTDAKILDMCTGTGCIGISLFLYGGFRNITLSDISKEALSIADFNAKKLAPGSGIEIIESDLFENIPETRKFDVIVSNPPYIRDSVIETLEPEVRIFEPRIALSGGADGLAFYRRIAEKAPSYAPRIFLEIGYDQAEEVSSLLREAGYQDIKVIKDYGGNDRVICGRTESE